MQRTIQGESVMCYLHACVCKAREREMCFMIQLTAASSPFKQGAAKSGSNWRDTLRHVETRWVRRVETRWDTLRHVFSSGCRVKVVQLPPIHGHWHRRCDDTFPGIAATSATKTSGENIERYWTHEDADFIWFPYHIWTLEAARRTYWHILASLCWFQSWIENLCLNLPRFFASKPKRNQSTWAYMSIHTKSSEVCKERSRSLCKPIGIHQHLPWAVRLSTRMAADL